MILQGDCLDLLRTLPAASVDACVTDPPYELGFMGKSWDSAGVAFDPETWRAILRVLKPGAHLVAFGGTRTYHRMICAIEDAGFEIRDCLSWLYGSGFPKSLNLPGGLGTALKPAWEPCVLARKPLAGTVAETVSQFGTGALNIADARIGDEERTYDLTMVAGGFETTGGGRNVKSGQKTVTGRWPANVMLDEEAAHALDAQSGEVVSGGTPAFRSADRFRNTYGAFKGQEVEEGIGRSAGGASRFYYVAKPSREERDMGTEGLTPRTACEATARRGGTAGLNSPRAGAGRTGGARNFHPTVKPVELMRWLVRLVTPPGGTVLDPFMGSGTTGMACRYELRQFIGIEREGDYVAIAERRIGAVAPLFGDVEVFE
jgi:hypothetical protein